MLESLGLGELEETVYNALVRRVEATAGEIASDVGTTPALARSALGDLVERGRVAAATQQQALAALLFLYREVLGRPLRLEGRIPRGRSPGRIPAYRTSRAAGSVVKT